MTDTSARPASGYSAWRLIAEELRAEIADGRIGTGERLPGEHALAERFGVNRHTVRQALASLAEEGIVESRRGSGTFATGRRVHVHRVGLRTRMSRSLGRDSSDIRRVLDVAIVPAPPRVAERLGIEPGAEVVRAESQQAGIAVSTHWFDATRYPRIGDDFRRTRSTTAALAAAGVADYVRAATSVTARHATAAEAETLGLEPGGVVLVTDALDALPDGQPVQHVVSRFAASRVTLALDHDA